MLDVLPDLGVNFVLSAETIKKIRERVMEVMAAPEMREKLRRLHVPQQHSLETRVSFLPSCLAGPLCVLLIFSSAIIAPVPASQGGI
jgi:hypothetical protein